MSADNEAKDDNDDGNNNIAGAEESPALKSNKGCRETKEEESPLSKGNVAGDEQVKPDGDAGGNGNREDANLDRDDGGSEGEGTPR